MAVNQLLLHLFSQLTREREIKDKKPLWVSRIHEILYENIAETLNLTELSKTLNIHPVHLSRDFHKYFHCNLGEYFRKLKVTQSMELLHLSSSLTDIALECGFADQSHFIRCFKENIGTTPLKYRNLLKNR